MTVSMGNDETKAMAREVRKAVVLAMAAHQSAEPSEVDAAVEAAIASVIAAPGGMGREVEAIALLREVADPDEQDMPASLGSVLLMRGRPLHDLILAFLAAAPEQQLAAEIPAEERELLAKPCANCGSVFLKHRSWSSRCPGWSYVPAMREGVHLARVVESLE